MRYRKLRIAWSVFWGLAAVLPLVLWVRSYWRLQILQNRSGSQAIQISSVKGHIAIARVDPRAAIGKSYLSVVAGDSANWRISGVLGFAYHHDGIIRALVAPHWVPALISAALAAIPWISRFYRFSLRTLLITTTLVAVVLGLIVYATQQ